MSCVDLTTNASVFTYFIDNRQTIGRRSVIFGVREMNASEASRACSNPSNLTPPITDQPMQFTADYALGVFTSGCYYLDENQRWQSDGLWVSCLRLFSLLGPQ